VKRRQLPTLRRSAVPVAPHDEFFSPTHNPLSAIATYTQMVDRMTTLVRSSGAAVVIADRHGEQGLTFRALSERLATGPGALAYRQHERPAHRRM
jgi:hypothetical protein